MKTVFTMLLSLVLLTSCVPEEDVTIREVQVMAVDIETRIVTMYVFEIGAYVDVRYSYSVFGVQFIDLLHNIKGRPVLHLYYDRNSGSYHYIN